MIAAGGGDRGRQRCGGHEDPSIAPHECGRSFQKVAVPTAPLKDLIGTAPAMILRNAASPSLKLDCRYVCHVIA